MAFCFYLRASSGSLWVLSAALSAIHSSLTAIGSSLGNIKWCKSGIINYWYITIPTSINFNTTFIVILLIQCEYNASNPMGRLMLIEVTPSLMVIDIIFTFTFIIHGKLIFIVTGNFAIILDRLYVVNGSHICNTTQTPSNPKFDALYPSQTATPNNTQQLATDAIFLDPTNDPTTDPTYGLSIILFTMEFVDYDGVMWSMKWTYYHQLLLIYFNVHQLIYVMYIMEQLAYIKVTQVGYIMVQQVVFRFTTNSITKFSIIIIRFINNNINNKSIATLSGIGGVGAAATDATLSSATPTHTSPYWQQHFHLLNSIVVI